MNTLINDYRKIINRLNSANQNRAVSSLQQEGGAININLCVVEDDLLCGAVRVTDCAGRLQRADLRRVMLRLRRRIASVLPLTARLEEVNRLRMLDLEAQAQLGGALC